MKKIIFSSYYCYFLLQIILHSMLSNQHRSEIKKEPLTNLFIEFSYIFW